MSDSTASLARSSAVMAAGTIVSRVLGMVRATMLGAVIGMTGLSADAFQVANTLPNLLFLLLAGGVLNAVLVPQLTKAAQHADGGQDFVDRLLTLSIVAMGVLTLVVTAAAGLLVRLFSQGFSPETMSLSISFALICLPQVFFYGLYTLLGQVLNARSQFAAYMWAPVVANVVSIAGMAIFLTRYPRQPDVSAWTPGMIWLLAGTTTLGIIAQALVLLVPLRRGGFRFRPRWGFRGVGLRSSSTVAGWTFAALGVSQASFIVTSKVLTRATSLSAEQHLHEPGLTAYSNAFLLFMLPHSLVTVSLVTALFTRMSKAANTGDLAEVRGDVSRGMRLTAVATVPATVASFVLGTALVGTLFFKNSAADVHATTVVMVAMMAGLVPFGTLYLLQRVYYAFEDARTPFVLQLVSSGVGTAISLVALTLPVAWMGIAVGLGQTVSNLAGASLGLVWARRRLDGLPLRPVARTYTRLGVAAVVAGGAAYLVRLGVESVVSGRVENLVTLVLAGLVFGVVYLVLARALRVREVEELLGPVVSKVRRLVPGA
ncbi:murein biosynthesis integral membrane protein MurJ [Oryzihumus sp.]